MMAGGVPATTTGMKMRMKMRTTGGSRRIKVNELSSRGRTSSVRVRSGTEQQWKQRAEGYESKLSRANMPPAWMRVRKASPSVRYSDGSVSLRVELEVSRQKVAARDAYMYVGQRAQFRLGDRSGGVGVNNDDEKDDNEASDKHQQRVMVDVSSPPFDDDLNWLPLYRLRGDIPTGATRTLHRSMRKPMTEEEEEELKRAQGDEVSVTSELELFFRAHDDNTASSSSSPNDDDVSSHANMSHLLAALDATNVGDEVDGVEIGPFAGSGLDFRMLMGTFMYRKLLFFTQASHIHVAKACIEDKTPHGLSLAWREENRLYYVLDSDHDDDTSDGAEIAFQNDFQRWEEHFNTRVRMARQEGGGGEGGRRRGEGDDSETGVFIGTPEEVFDHDDLEYFPEETGVIIFGDVNFTKRMRALAAAAEIPEENVLDSLTSVRKPVTILRAEQLDAYCPPDRLDEVPDFERELKDTGKSIV